MPPLLRGLTYITWCGNYGRACFVCHLVQTCEVVSFAACMPACDREVFTDHCNIPACICNSAICMVAGCEQRGPRSSLLKICLLTGMSIDVLSFRFVPSPSMCVEVELCLCFSSTDVHACSGARGKQKGGILRSRGEIVRGDSG